MQARLQVWSGSSISTRGTRSFPHHQFTSCHFIMSVAMWTGNRISPPTGLADERAACPGHALRALSERVEPCAEEEPEVLAQASFRDALLAREPNRARPPARPEGQRGHPAGHVELARLRVDHRRKG